MCKQLSVVMCNLYHRVTWSCHRLVMLCSRRNFLPSVAKGSKKYQWSALLVWIHGPVWTCSIKKRKYKHVIQIARVYHIKMGWMYEWEDSHYGPYDNMNYFDQTYNIWDGGEMKEDSPLDPII